MHIAGDGGAAVAQSVILEVRLPFPNVIQSSFLNHLIGVEYSEREVPTTFNSLQLKLIVRSDSD